MKYSPYVYQRYGTALAQMHKRGEITRGQMIEYGVDPSDYNIRMVLAPLASAGFWYNPTAPCSYCGNVSVFINARGRVECSGCGVSR